MLGDKIKELRKESNITQEVLAKKIGVSTSMVGMYETDARKPSYEVLLKIANYFNVSTDYLLRKSQYRNIWDKFNKTINVEQLKKDIEEISNNISENDDHDSQQNLIIEQEKYEVLNQLINILEEYGFDVKIYTENGNEKINIINESGTIKDMFVDDFIRDIDFVIKDIINKSNKNKAMSEENILTMAAHKVGHEGKLSEDELDKIKLAIQIALAKNKK